MLTTGKNHHGHIRHVHRTRTSSCDQLTCPYLHVTRHLVRLLRRQHLLDARPHPSLIIHTATGNTTPSIHTNRPPPTPSILTATIHAQCHTHLQGRGEDGDLGPAGRRHGLERTQTCTTSHTQGAVKPQPAQNCFSTMLASTVGLPDGMSSMAIASPSEPGRWKKYVTR